MAQLSWNQRVKNNSREIKDKANSSRKFILFAFDAVKKIRRCMVGCTHYSTIEIRLAARY
jgi:hypothetical protein